MKNNPTAIVIHCSDVSYLRVPDQFRSINSYHRDEREFPVSTLGIYVGYQRLITGGKNYKCREDNEEGAHTNQTLDSKSMNVQSLGICVGFDGDVEYPRADDYALLKAQVRIWQDTYGIPDTRVFYHRHFATDKTCPGSLLQADWMAALLDRGAPEPKAVSQYTNRVAIEEAARKEALTISLMQLLVERLTALYYELKKRKQ